MPGGYANVKLELRATPHRQHPGQRADLRRSGLRVATLGPDDKVLFKPVTIARDLGRKIELGSGVAADDRVIKDPPDGLDDGDQVRVTGPGAKGKPATASEKQVPKG